jgi:ribosomal protein S18 acetylase RimI-like enzyme
MGANADRHSTGDPRLGPSTSTRAGRPDDLGAVARLHASGIDQGFLSALGPRFLARLYARILREPGCFLLVAESPLVSATDGGRPDAHGGGAVVGFVAGSSDVRRLYRSFLRHDGLAAGLPAAPRLVRALPRVLETLRHGTGDDPGSGRGTELLAIAVDPAARGAGVGRLLVRAFLDRVEAGGGHAAHVVVGADNDAAVGLYRRAGFEDVRAFELHAGTRSLLLQWDRSAPVDVGNPGG